MGCIAKARQEEVLAKVKEEKCQGKMGGSALRTRRLLCLASLLEGGTHACVCWYTRTLSTATSNKRFSTTGRCGRVVAERKGVECVERQQRVSHIS